MFLRCIEAFDENRNFNATNYGGILQAIALYRQGHEVTLIYKEDTPFLWKEIIKSMTRKIPFCDINNIIMNKSDKKENRFIEEQEIFKISEDLYTKKELENFAKI